MLWLLHTAQVAEPTIPEVWCRGDDQALADNARVDPMLPGTPTKAFTVSHAGVRADWVLGQQGTTPVLAPTFRYKGQALTGWVDPVGGQHLYLGGEASVALGSLGEWVPGAQLKVVAGTHGEVVVEPPTWIVEALATGVASATVACDALTMTEDHARAEARTTSALAGHTERWLDPGTELVLHDTLDGREVGRLVTRSLDRSLFVAATDGAWTQVALRSWPRGVIWRGWVRDLTTVPPGDVGSGGGGSSEGMAPAQTGFATATCDHDVPLFVVQEARRVEVGGHASGDALILLEDHGDRAMVRLHDSWARPLAGWHFEATGLEGCARGEVRLP